ncbi:MAG: hypothetical protein P8J87_16935 [Verrucomicrobiales bacterium]|nr:hypothetical protein [Verrucomicrobiales bacterium]
MTDRSTLPLAVLAAGLAIATTASAGTLAYEVPAGAFGNQDFGGALGMEFNVRNAAGIDVTQIGAFDSGSDGLAVGITVALYDRATETIVPGTQTVVTDANSTANGGHRTVTLGAPIHLPVGNYAVVAQGYGAGDSNGNAPAIGQFTNAGGGAIRFVGTSRWGNAGTYPANPEIAGTRPDKYVAGTFTFDNTPDVLTRNTVAIEVPAGTPGIQNFGNPVGMDFVVTRPITVSSLGVFDSLSDGIVGSLTTELWSRDPGALPDDFSDDTGTTILATSTFTLADPGTLDGANRMKDLGADITLVPGAYTIVAHGFSADDLMGNLAQSISADSTIDSQLDTQNGAIQWVGSSRWGDAVAPFPTNPDGGPATRYLAGTFAYTVIPEPNPISLLTLTSLALFSIRRRR